MRFLLLLTPAIVLAPGLASAQSQCAVPTGSGGFAALKVSEPSIKLLPPVDVTGRPVNLRPHPTLAAGVTPASIAQQPSTSASPDSSDASGGDLRNVAFLRHVASAGALLTEVGRSHGLRTVFARHGEEFMVFQVTPDGQAGVAGLMTDLTIAQIRSVSGDALTDLGIQHGLHGYFLRNGSHFQVFYASPDDARLIPGVMWDATGHDVTRTVVSSIPGALPTVEIGPTIPGAHVTPAVARSNTGGRAQLADLSFGTAGNPQAPELWVFVDPQCSYSIRAMQQLQPFVDGGQVQLHVVPIAILDREDGGLSSRHALGLLSMASDRMVTAWETGEIADGSVEAGAKLEANMSAATASEVRGTPTFFWRKPDGGEGRYDGVPTDMAALVAALRT